ncbi:helix-turn-helix domain-containing protein [Paenibacillus planticolens]|uniref:Helix-turn-helix domain-containing protein n=1 Tax=Paenibacillus planticolens TaxID=2654976 RepID=A0ABX1ZYR4_9BACL|nr:helix-turn-helix domain-containing protein [Paenibacillus planticolens]NOV03994.1 helix-turn-helix domain-containing protein [Paenibacillus planticolens]
MSKSSFKSSVVSSFRMSWNSFKSKLLLKYVLSYILMFLVPLTGVTVIIYENAINDLRREIEQTNVNQLSQVKSTIDERMNELQQITSRIAYDKQLSSYMVHRPYYEMEAIDALGNYKANSSILEDLFLYFHQDENIYSYRGLTNVHIAFGNFYQYGNWNSEQIYRDLNEIKQPMIRPAENVNVNSRKDSMLTLLFPIKPNDLYPTATVVYLVDETKLTGVMDSMLSNFSGNSYIFTQDGQLLTSNNHGNALPQQVLESLSSLEPGIHSMKLDGVQHSVVSVRSTENNWNYVAAIPSYQFFSKVVHIQTLFLLVFFITVLFGIIVAILLAKRQYHPIRDLIEFTKRKSPDYDTTRNEWDWIKQTIHDYSARIDTQEPFVRNQCLLLLFKHGKPDDPEIERMVAGAGLEHPHGQGLYVSLILAWDDNLEGEESSNIRQRLQEMLSELEFPDLQARVYGVEFSTKDQLALLVSIPAQAQEPVRTRIEKVVEAIKDMIIGHAPIVPYLGVGMPYPDLASINQSFIEAATAIDNRILGSNGRVTYFEQLQDMIASPTEAYWIPKKLMLKLEQSLKQGNETVATQVIADLIAEIKEAAVPAPLLRCICFDLLNSLLRTAHELGVSEVFAGIQNFSVFETLEELEVRSTSLAVSICQQVERNTETDQPSLIEDIVAYVDQKFADYTLSLEHVALKYSVSISYLSRSFKEKVGHNFTQYIWQRRMDQVTRLLVNTTAPLKEIIEQVGYLDAPNFIRKFKKETGYTPGQYRKLFTAAKKEPE